MNIDRFSIPNRAVKTKGGGIYIYICGIYLSILNCGYIIDRIISDSNKYGSYNRKEMKEKGYPKKENSSIYFFNMESLDNEFNNSKINERSGWY